MSQYGRWSGNSSGGGGSVTTVTASGPLASSGGTTPDISIQTASGSQAGALSAADWTTFNNKGSGTVTNVSGTAPIVSSGGATPAISIPTATSLVTGALSSADWTTFNSKQASGSYLTALTGDATATGPGSASLTLSTVNANVGSFGTASNSPSFTVNAKGLITAASSSPILIGEAQVTNLTSDLAGKQATLTPGSVSTSTTGVTVGSGASSTVGPNVTVDVQTASGSQPGLISSADWTTFNSKQSAGSYITSLTGGVTASGPGAAAATVVTNANLTGPITSTGNATAVASQTGTGSTFVMDTSPTLITPNLGTPTTLVGTNISGTASGLTAGTVTTNANLTGDVTSVGNATTLTNAPVIAKVLTGYTSGAGTISSADSILSAIQKLNGNAPGTSATAKVIFVSQDTGNDSNAGTLYSPLKTIQAGITKAETIAAFYNQVIVNITPSSSSAGYNENLTMSQQGVTLQSYSLTSRSEAAIVKGTLTINLTGTSGGAAFIAASNVVYIKGMVFSANTASPICAFSGTTFQRLNLTDCYLENTGAGQAISMTNTGVNGVKSTITVANTNIYNNSATIPTILCSAGRYFTAGTTYDIQNNNASGPSFIVDGASATGSLLVLTQASIAGQISVTDNLATLNLSLCTIASGSLPGLVTPSSPNTGFISLANVGFTTTATNTITGSGIVPLLGNVVKVSTGGDIISTVTQTTINSFPQGSLMLGATATQNTNTLLTVKNGHLTSQQTTAPTSALQAGAGNTATRTLTRCTDTAGNISIAVAGTGIAAGAQLIVTFNKAYATAPVISLTPSNVNAPLLIGAYATSSTTTFTINFAAAGITGTTYTFMYQVIET